MMGQQPRTDSLFYYFRLEDQIPNDHLLKRLDRFKRARRSRQVSTPLPLRASDKALTLYRASNLSRVNFLRVRRFKTPCKPVGVHCKLHRQTLTTPHEIICRHPL
jgi:hypothetical protein